MKIRQIFIIIFILSANQLHAQVDRAINDYVNDTVFRNAGISICIRDIETGKILAAHNENMALTTA